MSNKSSVISNLSCWAAHAKYDVVCERNSCRHWIDHPARCNCVHVAVTEDNEHTLQEIADIYGLSRMRMCQVVKQIIQKLEEIDS